MTDALPTQTHTVPTPPYDPQLLGVDAESLLLLLTDDAALAAVRAAPEMTVADVQPLLDLYDLTQEDRVISIPSGEMILSIVRPRGAEGALPALYDIHAGAMIVTNRFAGFVPDLLALAATHQLAIITPEFSLAPETPAPGAAIECWEGLRWVTEHAEDIGVADGRVILSGASGGGGIAAAVALMARDQGSPTVLGQLLRCPMLDERDTTVSAQQFSLANGSFFGGWPTESNRYAWEAILGPGHRDRDVSDYESPARATDLHGLPPTFIDVGANEVFRDASVAYASRLWECGVSTELHVWAGAYHASDVIVPTALVSCAAAAARENWVQRIFGTAPTEEDQSGSSS